MDKELLAWLIGYLNRSAAKLLVEGQTSGLPQHRSYEQTLANIQRSIQGLENWSQVYPALHAIDEMLSAKYAVLREQEESMKKNVLLLNHNAPSWDRYELAVMVVEETLALDMVAALAKGQA